MVRDPMETVPSGLSLVTGVLDGRFGFWALPEEKSAWNDWLFWSVTKESQQKLHDIHSRKMWLTLCILWMWKSNSNWQCMKWSLNQLTLFFQCFALSTCFSFPRKSKCNAKLGNVRHHQSSTSHNVKKVFSFICSWGQLQLSLERVCSSFRKG